MNYHEEAIFANSCRSARSISDKYSAKYVSKYFAKLNSPLHFEIAAKNMLFGSFRSDSIISRKTTNFVQNYNYEKFAKSIKNTQRTAKWRTDGYIVATTN